MPGPCRSGTTDDGRRLFREGVHDAADRRARHQRQVDRHDQDGVGAAGDDIGPCLAEARVEAAAPLAEGPRAHVQGAGRGPRRSGLTTSMSVEPADGQGRHHRSVPAKPSTRSCRSSASSTLAEPRLGALERPTGMIAERCRVIRIHRNRSPATLARAAGRPT